MSTIQTIHSYTCDLNAGPKEVKLHTSLMHQDAQADVFRVSVLRSNEPVDLTGMTVRAYLYFASTRQTMLLEGEASQNMASITLAANCYAVPGFASLVIQLQEGSVRHTVLKVNLCFARTGSENVILPDHVLPSLQELLAQIDAMEQATNAAQEAAAAANAASAQVQQNAKDIQALEERVSTLEESGGSGGNSGTDDTGTTASLNQWNYATTVTGQLQSDGTVDTSATAYVTSDFIPFTEGETVHFYMTNYGNFESHTPSSGNGSILGLFDADKGMISRLAGDNIPAPYPIPAGVAYIRYGIASAHFNNTNYVYGIFRRTISASEFDTYSAGNGNSGSGTSSSGGTTGLVSNLQDKNILVIGDSLTAADAWQKELVSMGAAYTNHALGGIGLQSMIDGDDSIAALSVEEVSGKDGIILFGGINNMRTERGELGAAGNTEIVVTSRNKMDHAKFGYGIPDETGTLNGDEAYTTSDYMPFVNGEKLYLYVRLNDTGAVSLNTMESGDGASIRIYDADKTLLKTVTPTIANPYTIDEANAAYVRFTYASTFIRNTAKHNGIFKEVVDATTFDEYAESAASADTVASLTQHAIDRIYELLAEAGNLTCRLMVVTPYCFGASDYNEDAFAMDGIGLAQIIQDVANYNGMPVYNAYKNSGINPTTLAVWGKADNDHLHLNSAGYAHLGKRIANFANDHIMA